MKKYLKGFICIILILTVLVVAAFAFLIYKSSTQSLGKKLKDSGVGNMDNYSLMQRKCTVEPIKEGMLNGFHIKPDNKSKNGVVVTFGGSDGGCDFDRAVALSQSGYEVFALFFFGQDNQPEGQIDIPLEFFEDFLKYTKTNDIALEPLTLIGTSRGAHLSLLLSNYYEEIDNVVLFAPSSYNIKYKIFNRYFYMFSYKGNGIEGVNLPIFKGLLSSADMYSQRKLKEEVINDCENKEEARIKIGKINGEILIFAGDDDRLGPADTSAKEIYESNPGKVHINIYKNAGHAFSQDIASIKMYGDWGGTAEGNFEALMDSSKKLKEYLAKWHGSIK